MGGHGSIATSSASVAALEATTACGLGGALGDLRRVGLAWQEAD